MCACAVPATASAQCGPPKGVIVANAEMANALYLFVGQTGDNPSSLVPGAATFAGVAAQYPLKVLRAIATEPPQCRAHPARARQTRRASAGRRR